MSLNVDLAVRWAYSPFAYIRDHALIILKALFFLLNIKKLAKPIPIYIIITRLRLAYSSRST